MAEAVLSEVDGPIGTILLNRPRVLNALNLEAWQALDGALEALGRHPDLRAVIMAGEGRAFCAGADLREMDALANDIQAGRKSLADVRAYKAILQGITRKMVRLPVPIIAAVHGYAVGAGCELALSCDLIVVEEDARLGFPEVNVGLTITNAGTFFLPRAVGAFRAKELAFTGEVIDGREAHRIGLANRVVPAGGARAAARELAEVIAGRAPLAVRLHKAALNSGMAVDLEAAMAHEVEAVVIALLSEDHREGARAFLEKRPPTFRGR